jgi:hypothetical protein
MKESDLYIPVRDWLRACGHVVHVEVFGVDVVGIRDDQLTAVELKLSNPGALLTQCVHNAGWATECYGVLPHRPKNTNGFKYHGIGLLIVVGGRVREVCKPKPQPWSWHKRRDYRMKKLMGRQPAGDHELAGLPCCRQLREQRAIRNDPQPKGGA